MRITQRDQCFLRAGFLNVFLPAILATCFQPAILSPFLATPLLAEEAPRVGAGIPSAGIPSVPSIPSSHLPAQPRPITQSSGYAFAGTVQRVEHIAPAGRNGIGTTRIIFRVDTAIRGVQVGQALVISEWAGLWASGERYRPGERVCLFLYPPSKLGLTSPVHGAAGRFRVTGDGRIVVHPEQRAVLPQSIRRRLAENGEISVEEFVRALKQRSAL